MCYKGRISVGDKHGIRFAVFSPDQTSFLEIVTSRGKRICKISVQNVNLSFARIVKRYITTVTEELSVCDLSRYTHPYCHLQFTATSKLIEFLIASVVVPHLSFFELEFLTFYNNLLQINNYTILCSDT